MNIPLSWSAWEQESNRLSASRAEGLKGYSTEWLFEMYLALGLGRAPAVEVPEDFLRIVEQLAATSIFAELRRCSEVSDLEDGLTT